MAARNAGYPSELPGRGSRSGEPLPTAPLDCPLHVFAGIKDRATLEQLQGWSEHADAGFSFDMFPGGHFFIHEYESAVLERLTACLSATMPAQASPAAEFA